MSQITRCPFCATTFKVVADQLRISDGWVRCGQCREVFDASEHLLLSGHEPLLPELPGHDVRGSIGPGAKAPDNADLGASARATMAPAAGEELQPTHDAAVQPVLPPIAAEPDPSQPSVPAFPVRDPVATHTEGDASADIDSRVAGLVNAGSNQDFTPPSSLLERAVLPEPEPEPEPEASSVSSQQEIPGYELPGASYSDSTWPQDVADDAQAASAAAVPDAVQASPPESIAASSEAGDAPVVSSALQESESLQAEPITAEDAVPTPVAAMAGSAQADVAPLPAEPEFVKAARRSAFWQRPLVRGGLVLAGLMLVLTLGMQMVLQERDAIAARSPAAHALMEQLCQPLQCTLQPPRRIDALVIDSSSFLKARHGVSTYQLQMGIKNNSTLTVAMPALELTLTDAHDETLLRRVLLRDELGAPAQLAPGAVWSGTVPMQVMQEASRVAGYRLLAFYP